MPHTAPRSRRAARAAVPAAVLAIAATTAVPASAAPSGPEPAPPAPSIAAAQLAHAVFAPTGPAGATGASSSAAPAPRFAPAGMPRPAGLSADVAQGGVPDVNLAAYTNAAGILAEQMPACGIDWTLIAGIGMVESTHAHHGAADDEGTLLEPIYGPLLDGTTGGNEVATDTDGGRIDGNADYDRAVGPTQFLPATWEHYAADGNGDGTADPQNLYDAALTTGRYLCDGGLDLRNPADVVTAVLRYNHSTAYVDKVVGFARTYTGS